MNEKMDTLITANNYLYNLISGINKLVDNIQNNKESEGILLIPDIADGIGWILDVLFLTESIHGINSQDDELDNKLNEVVEALENEDYILVGDLFNYEILPVLGNYHAKIRKLVAN